jgi:MFS family permease
VVGRLILLRFDRHSGIWAVLALCLAGMTLGVLTLALAGAVPNLIFGYAVLQGAAIGVMTILRPVLIADVMGQAGYGAIAGSLQVLPLMAGAASPLVGGVLFDAGGAAALIWASAALIGCGFIGTRLLRRL